MNINQSALPYLVEKYSSKPVPTLDEFISGLSKHHIAESGGIPVEEMYTSVLSNVSKKDELKERLKKALNELSKASQESQSHGFATSSLLYQSEVESVMEDCGYYWDSSNC